MRRRWPAALTPLALVGCLSSAGPEDDLATARDRWAAAYSGSYGLMQRVTCFCLPEVTRPVLMVVNEAGAVTSLVYEDDGTVVPAEYRSTFRTVDALFAEIANAYAAGAAEVRVTYDPDNGIPTDVFIDRDRQLADEEIGWTTSYTGSGFTLFN